MGDVKFCNLESERLVLRKFKESDAEAFFKYRTDPRVILYQGEGWVDYKYEQAVEFAREQMNSEPGIPETWFQIAVELKETGEMVGDCAIHTLPDADQAEIGYTISPAHQNRGLGTETVKRLLGYLFNELGMHRVIAVTDVRNTGSNRVLEKVGMRKEGHFIKNSWNKGEYTDEFLFAMLNEEWKGKPRS